MLRFYSEYMPVDMQQDDIDHLRHLDIDSVTVEEGGDSYPEVNYVVVDETDSILVDNPQSILVDDPQSICLPEAWDDAANIEHAMFAEDRGPGQYATASLLFVLGDYDWARSLSHGWGDIPEAYSTEVDGGPVELYEPFDDSYELYGESGYTFAR